ncbi:hypothetical protein Hanom_Chr04g00348411 [Helianthus anomalus]
MVDSAASSIFETPSSWVFLAFLFFLPTTPVVSEASRLEPFEPSPPSEHVYSLSPEQGRFFERDFNTSLQTASLRPWGFSSCKTDKGLPKHLETSPT